MTFAATPGGMLTLPPLRLGESLHPRHDRRAVNGRWLLATTVLALAAAALLGGTLQAGLHRAMKVRPAELSLAPGLGRVGSTDGRGDKLALRNAPRPGAPSPITTQTLQSTGLGDRPLTVLVADLAHMSALERVPDEPPLLQAGAEAGMVHDRAAPHGALPPLVLFGSATPAEAPRVASYAPAALPAWAEPGQLGTALNVTEQQKEPAEAPDRDSVVIAQRGDPLGRLLPGFGLTAANLAELAGALHVGPLAGGERFVLRLPAVQLDPAARPTAIRLERSDGTSVTAALSDDERYLPVAQPAGRTAASTGTAASDGADAGEIDDASLHDGLDALAGHDGVGRPLAAAVMRVLGTDLDLGNAVAAGDKIAVLFGTDPAEGEDQELDYAALTAGGKTTRLYRFAATDDNSIDYYDEDGHSLTKFLLRKPVANGRLGDGFGWRTHPILGDRRFHEGVDYAAPYGSPIVAAGAGTVEKIDFESGYGKYIRIRHDLGYETTYAHVAGYPRGIAVGRRVQQGETIALVGSTGLSTGPHLYYEVRVNDRNVDPTRIRIAAGRILEGSALAAFARRRDRIDTLLKATRPNNS